jgi:hypothetical protein
MIFRNKPFSLLRLLLFCLFCTSTNFLFAQITDSLIVIKDTLIIPKVLPPNPPRQDVILFVNGYWEGTKFAPAHVNKEGYWQYDSIEIKPKSSWNFNQYQGLAFLEEAYRYFGTRNVLFIDGGNFNPITKAATRQAAGRQFAATELEDLLRNYKLSDTSRLHFVKHSMGGAYSEGIIEELLAKKKWHIGKVIHIATSEASRIKTQQTTFGPEIRIQLISQGDETVRTVNRLHGYPRDNLCSMIPNCNRFAVFYENVQTFPRAGTIGHALHARSIVFDIIRDLERMELIENETHCQLRHPCDWLPYRKIYKDGLSLEYNVEGNFFEKK